MADQSVTLSVPDVLYDRLERRARQTQRTVEAEMLEVIAAAVPVADELPFDLAEAISPLAVLDDTALWRAARSHLSRRAATALEALHLKQQREGLTEAETQESAVLVRQYERAMLVRAQAAALLKQRGYDITDLAPKA